MASGFGWSGGRSRCFHHWQEFSKCYAQADHPQQCRLQAEDYAECLHHKREIARAEAIQTEFIRKAVHNAQEERKMADTLTEGTVTGVGLIQRDKGEGSQTAESS